MTKISHTIQLGKLYQKNNHILQFQTNAIYVLMKNILLYIERRCQH